MTSFSLKISKFATEENLITLGNTTRKVMMSPLQERKRNKRKLRITHHIDFSFFYLRFHILSTHFRFLMKKVLIE